MAETKIEWTGTLKPDGEMVPGYTFNPWIGCAKVSAGCANCYAEADMGNRRKRVVWGVNGSRSITSYSYWRQALSWDRQAKEDGVRRKVFCASLADVFEDWDGQLLDSQRQPLWWKSEWCNAALGLAHTCEEVSGRPNYGGEKFCDVDGIPAFAHWNEEYMAAHLNNIDGWVALKLDIVREYLFRLIQMTPNLDWLLVTKRPENIMRMVPEHWQNKFPDNVWVGTSVENQAAVDLRVPQLKKVPAEVRFLSCEPLLEELRLRHVIEETVGGMGTYVDHLTGVNWVICGGESGAKKRPFKEQWAANLMNQCKNAGVAFFMKQIDKVQPVPEYLMLREFPV